MEETSHENFYKAADAIAFGSKDLYLGARSSLALATFCPTCICCLKMYFWCSPPAKEIFEQMIRIDENDVVIGIGFPRYSARR